jgi:hypothetical protein
MRDDLFSRIPAAISGIQDQTKTYGAAWGDFNNDGFTDLWVNNHQEQGSLYLNQKDGTFRNITAETFAVISEKKLDEHGTAWVDYDNDGDLDLINVVGSGRGAGIGKQFNNLFYVNESGTLVERATSLGIADSLSRARSILWLDYNKDGLLDLIVGAIPRSDGIEAPVKIFVQEPDGTFADASEITGFSPDSGQFFVYSDLSGDGAFELISSSNKVTIYDTTSLPFQDVTSTIVPSQVSLNNANDIVSADFNGDLKPDLFVAKSVPSRNNTPSELFQKDSNSLITRLLVQESEAGIKFTTEGAVNFNILTTDGRFSVPLEQIYIGRTGKNLKDFGFDFPDPRDLNFTLSPDDPNVRGIFPHTPGQDVGIYIGYNAALQTWQLLLSSDANSQSLPTKNSLVAVVEAVEPITQTKSVGFDADSLPPKSKLLLSSESGLVDRTMESNINEILAQHKSAVAGDFDNDMDEDLFVVTSTEVSNTTDILFENQGDGTFVAVPKAGGAGGPNSGTGNFVVTADYDLNGFLDLFVANVGEETPTPLIDNNSYELLQNQGNGNNWLQIDLRGIESNRDGVGAQLFLTAGGVTQMRQQYGGMHDDVQNSQRIHFGLAKNTIVDELKIVWPSGKTQLIKNIAVNQLIEVVEAGDNGDNKIIGEDSNDFIAGRNGQDLLRGGKGNDRLGGGKDDDSLFGEEGNDLLLGRKGNDELFGGSGKDILDGGQGSDTLTGGKGEDSYRLNLFRASPDSIEDFSVADDTILVSALVFAGGLMANVPINPTQLRLGATATTAAQRFIYNPNNGDLFFDRDGSRTDFTQVPIANLGAGLELTNEDIFVTV